MTPPQRRGSAHRRDRLRRHGAAGALPGAQRPARVRARARVRRRRGARAHRRVLANLFGSRGARRYADRVHGRGRRAHRARPGPRTRRAPARWPARSRRSSTAPRRCRSRCRSRRPARSTSRAPGGCWSSPSWRRSAGGLDRYGHVSTAYVAGTHDGRFAESRPRRRPGASTTPTSSPSSRPSSWSARSPDLPVHDHAPQHRRRRPAQRLDVGVQRPLLAAAGVRAGPVRGGARRSRRRRSTSSRSTTSPTASTSCARVPAASARPTT